MSRADAIGRALTEEELERFCEYLYRRTGMTFGESKRYYIDRRVGERMKATGDLDFRDYFGRLRSERGELEQVINAFTVNETYFYREAHQFACMSRELLPALVRAREAGSRVRILCIPCASGEEPYSVALWLLENWPLVDAYNVEIVGADIDTAALGQAREGWYEPRSLSRLSTELVDAYFEPADGDRRRIIRDLRESVSFTSANLIEAASLRALGQFDLIFCRNVLIYFDDAARRSAAEHLYDALIPGGFLLLGHSEFDGADRRSFQLAPVPGRGGLSAATDVMSEDLLPYFLAEGRELVERAGEALFDLDRGVEPAEAVERAFRAVHTLKGSAGLFDMSELGALLHAAESELEAARRRGGAMSAEQMSALNECIGETERWIEALEAEGSVPPDRRRAAAALEPRLRGSAPSTPARPTASVTRANWAQDLIRIAGLDTARSAVRYAPDAEAYFRGEDPLAVIRTLPDLLWLELDRVPSEADTPFACDLVLRALSGAAPEAVAAALRLVGDQTEIVEVDPAEPAQTAAPLATRTVRVEAASLDAASDLLDQLIIAKNALAHETASALGDSAAGARGVAGAQLALDRAAAALHGAVGRMRLAPLRRLFAPLPRQVREMADALGKQAELTISGEEVAVDKAILDGLYEPLIHILRNAVDHGVEPPTVRIAAGKPARAVIRLAAAPRGDVAVIEVADDGAGLDLPRVRQIAVERGLISPATAEALSDRQAAELIFMPGFSTARTVTDLSGRGVGLDAVRAALARIGGRVEVETEPSGPWRRRAHDRAAAHGADARRRALCGNGTLRRAFRYDTRGRAHPARRGDGGALRRGRGRARRSNSARASRRNPRGRTEPRRPARRCGH